MKTTLSAPPSVERSTVERDGGAKRLPLSGSMALAAGAFIQAILGVEFLLSGLNKIADPRYVDDFRSFVSLSPGAHHGPLAPLVTGLVLPHLNLAAYLAMFTELSVGVVLLIGAVEIARRRLPGRLGAEHGYEATLALLAAAAGLVLAGFSFTIYLLQGGTLPSIQPGRAFSSAIPVELLLVPLGLGIAWLEWGRYGVLRRPGSVGR